MNVAALRLAIGDRDTTFGARYAKGEITREAFEEMRRHLGEQGE